MNENNTYYEGTAKVPKEIDDIRTVVAFGLDARQLTCAILGLGMVVVAWFLFIRTFGWPQVLGYFMVILLAAPFLAYGFWRPIGLKPEDYVAIWWANNVKSCSQRKMIARNEYEQLMLRSEKPARSIGLTPKKRKLGPMIAACLVPPVLILGLFAVLIYLTSASGASGSVLIVLAVVGIFAMVTIGSAGSIYWDVRLNGELANLCPDEKMIPTLRLVLLDLATFGVYGAIWAKKQGRLVDRLSGKDRGTGTKYLIFSLLGLRLIAECGMQKAINAEMSHYRMIV